MNLPYELIIAIVDKGTSDLVMDAARAAGAPGGTVLHAKGHRRRPDAQVLRHLPGGRSGRWCSSWCPQRTNLPSCAASPNRPGPKAKPTPCSFPCPSAPLRAFPYPVRWKTPRRRMRLNPPAAHPWALFRGGLGPRHVPRPQPAPAARRRDAVPPASLRSPEQRAPAAGPGPGGLRPPGPGPAAGAWAGGRGGRGLCPRPPPPPSPRPQQRSGASPLAGQKSGGPLSRPAEALRPALRQAT